MVPTTCAVCGAEESLLRTTTTHSTDGAPERAALLRVRGTDGAG